MGMVNKQGAGPEQWDLLIDRCITRIRYLESNRLLWKRYMAAKTILDGQQLQAALNEFVEVGLGLGNNRLDEMPTERGNSHTLVGILSPWCFFCSSWWCVDPEDNKEETLGHRSSPIKVRCDAPTDFLVEPCSFTIPYVDSDIAGKRVGESNTQLFSWDWPGGDEAILPIVTSIINTTIFSIMNATIASLPDPSRKIWELWGCKEEHNGDGGPYPNNVTPIFDDNTATELV